MNKEVIIIGGGVAGLSAGIAAVQHDIRPIILERNRYLGGRVRSFHATDLQRTLDNGQHLISAAYHQTIAYLRTVGSLDKIHFQKKLQVDFVRQPEQQFLFQSCFLPSPLHFLLPLLIHKKLAKVKFGKLVEFVQKSRQVKPAQLRKMTVSEWLKFCGQENNLITLLYQPLTFSILNTPVEEASAYLLCRAMEDSFLHSFKGARLGIPKDWLGEIFVKPAEDFIQKHGGSIYRLNAVSKFIQEGDRISSVISNKQPFDSPWIINTTPPHALASVLRESGIRQLNQIQSDLTGFSYHPILTANIFLKEALPVRFPAAVLDSPIQWIFPHPRNDGQREEFGYALVTSAADELAAKPASDIISVVEKELARVLGVSGRIIDYKIIKEKRATIAQTPEALQWRQPPETAISNFFLAGDWTDTDLPATIEGAILSGRRALELVLKNMG